MTPAGPLDWGALSGKRRHGMRNARGTRDPAALKEGREGGREEKRKDKTLSGFYKLLLASVA